MYTLSCSASRRSVQTWEFTKKATKSEYLILPNDSILPEYLLTVQRSKVIAELFVNGKITINNNSDSPLPDRYLLLTIDHGDDRKNHHIYSPSIPPRSQRVVRYHLHYPDKNENPELTLTLIDGDKRIRSVQTIDTRSTIDEEITIKHGESIIPIINDHSELTLNGVLSRPSSGSRSRTQIDSYSTLLPKIRGLIHHTEVSSIAVNFIQPRVQIFNPRYLKINEPVFIFSMIEVLNLRCRIAINVEQLIEHTKEIVDVILAVNNGYENGYEHRLGRLEVGDQNRDVELFSENYFHFFKPADTLLITGRLTWVQRDYRGSRMVDGEISELRTSKELQPQPTKIVPGYGYLVNREIVKSGGLPLPVSGRLNLGKFIDGPLEDTLYLPEIGSLEGWVINYSIDNAYTGQRMIYSLVLK